MAKYANRTCCECGIKLPQPEMYRVEESVKVGSSKRSLSLTEVAFGAFGNESAKKSVARRFTSPNKRTHTRTKTSWYCENHAPSYHVKSRQNEIERQARKEEMTKKFEEAKQERVRLREQSREQMVKRTELLTNIGFKGLFIGRPVIELENGDKVKKVRVGVSYSCLALQLVGFGFLLPLANFKMLETIKMFAGTLLALFFAALAAKGGVVESEMMILPFALIQASVFPFTYNKKRFEWLTLKGFKIK